MLPDVRVWWDQEPPLIDPGKPKVEKGVLRTGDEGGWPKIGQLRGPRVSEPMEGRAL